MRNSPILPALLLALLAAPLGAQDSPKDLPKEQWPLQERINAAVARGAAWLRATIPGDGLCRSEFGAAGRTALTLYALAASGVPKDDPAVLRAADALRKLPVKEGTAQDLMGGEAALRMTYAHSLAVLAFTTLDPVAYRKEIARSVQVLVRAQKSTGQWAYIVSMGGPLDGGDNSNTQFALLALRRAALAGFRIPEQVWKRSEAHFMKSLDLEAGGWGYGCSGSLEGVYGSMTAVGVASLVICRSMLLDPEDAAGHPYLRDPAIARGMIWLEDHFAAALHPGIADVSLGGMPAGPDGRPGQAPPPPGGFGGLSDQCFQYYWLYAVERVGMLLGRRFIGSHDWYRAGAEWLLSQQRPDGSWINPAGAVLAPEPPFAATCFALLFLERATLPVVTPPPEIGAPGNR